MQTGHPMAPLTGATIVVTRAPGTTASLARAVRRMGGRAVLLPGLALRPLPDRDVRKAVGKSAFDVWIFASPAAVRFGVALLPAVRRARGHVFGLGDGTARALARNRIDAVIPADRSDSEGLLALRELAKVRGRRIALVGAPGGRDLIAPALRRRGAKVDALHVYRRTAPRLTRRHFDALDAAPDPLITLVSSGEALANLVALLPAPQVERMRGQIIVVSSARLAAVARENAFAEIVLARSAASRDLLAAAESALAHHRL